MIITGITKLDEIFYDTSGIILDIFGKNGSGKTQFLFQMCVNAIKSGGTVLYIDTNSGFRPERILELAKKFNSDIDFLNKIYVHRVLNTSEQIESSKKILHNDFSLVIIDNVTDLFSFEFAKEKNLYEKNSLFLKYFKELTEIIINKKIPLVVTNMIREIEGKEMENMKTVIDQFTHIKIHLTKFPKFHKGEINYPFTNDEFLFEITKNGLENYAQDI